MKKFLFTYHGMWEYTDEMKAAWGEWFDEIADSIVDGGNPLGDAHEVTADGETRRLTPDDAPAVGYTMIQADDVEEALELLADCPIIEKVRVYEAMSM